MPNAHDEWSGRAWIAIRQAVAPLQARQEYDNGNKSMRYWLQPTNEPDIRFHQFSHPWSAQDSAGNAHALRKWIRQLRRAYQNTSDILRGIESDEQTG